MSDIEIIDGVISSLYDDYEQEQEYAQKVISAWNNIKTNIGVWNGVKKQLEEVSDE